MDVQISSICLYLNWNFQLFYSVAIVFKSTRFNKQIFSVTFCMNCNIIFLFCTIMVLLSMRCRCMRICVCDCIIRNWLIFINTRIQYARVCLCDHYGSKIVTLLQKVNNHNGEALEENPDNIKNGESCIVRMIPLKPFCVESFTQYASLGRFLIRDKKHIVAVGIIKNTIRNDVIPEVTVRFNTFLCICFQIIC